MPAEIDEVRKQVLGALAAVVQQRAVVVQLERDGQLLANAMDELAWLIDELLLRLEELESAKAHSGAATWELSHSY